MYTVKPIQYCLSVFPLVDVSAFSDLFVDTVQNVLTIILPISDFVGLISWHVGLLWKLGLWSLSVIKASLFAVVLILSSRANLVAMVLASVSVAMTLSKFVFL